MECGDEAAAASFQCGIISRLCDGFVLRVAQFEPHLYPVQIALNGSDCAFLAQRVSAQGLNFFPDADLPFPQSGDGRFYFG